MEAIKKLQKHVERLNTREYTEECRADLLTASRQLDDLFLKQEIYWAQRSRVAWLKHGDKNTKFFHSKASQRRRKNYIQGIKDRHDNWVEEAEDITGVAIDYFENMFRVGNCDRMTDCLSAVSYKVTTNMKEVLTSEYTTEEVRVVLFQMGPTKSPGPDGTNDLFYQNFWHIVGDDVTTAVLDNLNNGNMMPDINYTHIILIPKIKSPEKMTDFRPISLCNVIYKIISKLLANRLKQILPQLISLTQSAFVPGHLITDNMLVLHMKHKGRKGSLALKLDIGKAYDHVEWSFLNGIMAKLGLPKVWIDRVMGCVTSPSFSICINGKLYGHTIPSRGLHLGDPLSPYLFLLCAEGFTALLTKAEMEGRIHGIFVCRKAPSISHLLFADDSLLFCQASNDEVQVINQTLHLYEAASG